MVSGSVFRQRARERAVHSFVAITSKRLGAEQSPTGFDMSKGPKAHISIGISHPGSKAQYQGDTRNPAW